VGLSKPYRHGGQGEGTDQETHQDEKKKQGESSVKAKCPPSALSKNLPAKKVKTVFKSVKKRPKGIAKVEKGTLDAQKRSCERGPNPRNTQQGGISNARKWRLQQVATRLQPADLSKEKKSSRGKAAREPGKGELPEWAPHRLDRQLKRLTSRDPEII